MAHDITTTEAREQFLRRAAKQAEAEGARTYGERAFFLAGAAWGADPEGWEEVTEEYGPMVKGGKIEVS